MTTLPEAVYDVAAVRELERRAMAQGIAETELMRRAGEAAWQVVQRRWPAAKHIVVLAGAGNNAGDGYVLAACAQAAGCKVTVLSCGDTGRLKNAAADARTRYLDHGGLEQDFSTNLPDADLLVDALLGTGLDRALGGSLLATVNAINHASISVLALDIPSGLHADTGAVLGAAVKADATITFIALKPGLLTGAGTGHCGELLIADLGVPANCFDGMVPVARRLSPADSRLPKRERDAHKGRFGHVLIVGGDHGMGGAVRLAAESALRTGAGLVSVATRAAHVPSLLAGLPEAIVHAVESTAELAPLLQRASVVAVGPGLGQSAWGAALFEQVLASELPLVVDADALNLLAHAPRQRENWVLTPHPGEAGRLLGQATSTVQRDRLRACTSLHARYHGCVVLKGAGSLIAAADEPLVLCDLGNPGMAGPGMGDALTGVIAALIAQGFTPAQAARAGVYLHAQAGDRAALRGERGLLARDLIGELRGLVNLP